MVDLDAVLALGERTHELLLREVNELVLGGVERSGGDGRERRHEILLCDELCVPKTRPMKRSVHSLLTTERSKLPYRKGRTPVPNRPPQRAQ